MHDKAISNTQGVSLIVLFLTSSSLLFVMGSDAKKDVWLATILAIIMALPMAFIYTRLHNIFIGKDLYDMIEICFGRFIGRGIIMVLTMFFLYWTSDVMVNFESFIRSVGLQNTPRIIPIILLATLCSWGINNGVKALGRWSQFFLLLLVISVFTFVILLSNRMDIKNILPILDGGIRPVLKGAFVTFSAPFIQIIAFSIAFSNFEEKSPRNIYVLGLITAGVLLIITSITNILVIGVGSSATSYYPTYISVARMNIGNFIQRLEVIVAIIFILSGFIKISILLLCTCKGITKIFGSKDYRFIITPVTLLMVNLAFFQYSDMIHYYEFQVDIWTPFVLPFQAFFPVILWGVAELKSRRFSRSNM